MAKIEELEELFFRDLKSYNSTNFKSLIRSDLSKNSASVHKAFSSVVTRYFIFREKHADELTETEFNMLYFKLKIDLISQYFADYPNSNLESLRDFQQTIRLYENKWKESNK